MPCTHMLCFACVQTCGRSIRSISILSQLICRCESGFKKKNKRMIISNSSCTREKKRRECDWGEMRRHILAVSLYNLLYSPLANVRHPHTDTLRPQAYMHPPGISHHVKDTFLNTLKNEQCLIFKKKCPTHIGVLWLKKKLELNDAVKI